MNDRIEYRNMGLDQSTITMVANVLNAKPPTQNTGENMANDLAEGTKYDDGKVPLDLWSPEALEKTAEVLAYGAIKYVPYNWTKGIKYRRVFAALLRHLWAFWRGEDNDPETGFHHLAHAMCCLMFLLHYESRQGYKDFDDRFDYDNAVN